jgi:hypothetical protein
MSDQESSKTASGLSTKSLLSSDPHHRARFVDPRFKHTRHSRWFNVMQHVLPISVTLLGISVAVIGLFKLANEPSRRDERFERNRRLPQPLLRNAGTVSLASAPAAAAAAAASSPVPGPVSGPGDDK